MLSVALSTAGLLWLGAALVTPSFAEVWHREVLGGSSEAVATDYEKIYTSPPSETLRPEIRQKAAFRAGLCFQRRGQLRSARRAFRTVLDMRQKAPLLGAESLLDEAAFRLKRLESASAGSLQIGSRQRRAAQQALMDFGAVEAERQAALKSLGNALDDQRHQILEDRQLVDRLAELGVLLSFPEKDTATVHSAEVIESLRNAFPREVPFLRVQAALAERFFLRALLDRERASTPLAKIARRELLGEEMKQRGLVRRDVRRLLTFAKAAESKGRRDNAFGPLAEIRLRLDWTRPVLRADPEIREIEDRAARRFLLLGEPSWERGLLVERWRGARRQADEILLRAEKLVDEMTQAARYRAKAMVGGRADAVEVCREEAERLFSVARKADNVGNVALVSRSVRQGQSILGWVLAEPSSSNVGSSKLLKRRGISPAGTE